MIAFNQANPHPQRPREPDEERPIARISIASALIASEEDKRFVVNATGCLLRSLGFAELPGAVTVTKSNPGRRKITYKVGRKLLAYIVKILYYETDIDYVVWQGNAIKLTVEDKTGLYFVVVES